MKNILTAAFIASTSIFVPSSPVHSQELYFQESTEYFYIYGDFYNSEGANPACIIYGSYDDGSFIQVIFDLVEENLSIHVTNTAWNINGALNSYNTLEIGFMSDQNLSIGEYRYRLLEPNSIEIENVRLYSFMRAFGSNAILVFVMPENIENMYVMLYGSLEANHQFASCLNYYLENT
jgi:hypothetical protein